jgi:hypothetical protein
MTTPTQPSSFKSPQFVLELVALIAVNALAVLSNNVTVAIGVDAAVLGYHVGQS